MSHGPLTHTPSGRQPSRDRRTTTSEVHILGRINKPIATAILAVLFVALALVFAAPSPGDPAPTSVLPVGPTATAGPPPCKTVSARDFNSALRLRRKLGGNRNPKFASKPVCVRPHYRKVRADIKRLIRPCEKRGDPGCKWLIQWRKLSAYDRTWTLRIGSCESGNNPKTNTGNGFLGAHQWVLSTWHAAGGSGSPVDASWHEQAVRAVRWRNKTSTMQWPACSIRLGYA